MKCDVLVAGAGLAGCTAARILAEQGKKVFVLEKREEISGNCYDFRDENGITIHRYGPHIFHTNDKLVWDFVNRFTPFFPFQHKVLAYAEGRLIQFPINRDTICDVFGINIPVADIHTFLEREIEKAQFNNPPKNFRDVVVSQVGERLYDLFFKNYTRKQWETDPENLSPEVANRIPVRENRDPRYFSDKYQGIPKLGYTGMMFNMLDHTNITVMTNADFFTLRDSIEYKQIVYTGKLDEYFGYKHGKLNYRSVRFDFETIEEIQYQTVSVVNYPNDYDFTRITEFKHFTGEKSEKTVLCREYPSAEGDPCYVVMTKENLEKRQRYLAEIKKEESEHCCLFTGRLAEYRYYNMDQVIAAVMEKVTVI